MSDRLFLLYVEAAVLSCREAAEHVAKTGGMLYPLGAHTWPHRFVSAPF